MENKRSWMLTLMVLFSCSAAMAQSNAEAEIRNLDQQELQAVFKRDTTALSKIWAPEFLVNNPSNQIFTRKQVANLIATGKIDYSSFDRKIERVSIIDNTAIVMGGEVVKPKGLATNAGKTVVRRFTNIWMKRDNVWKLVGRQATIVSIQ